MTRHDKRMQAAIDQTREILDSRPTEDNVIAIPENSLARLAEEYEESMRVLCPVTIEHLPEDLMDIVRRHTRVKECYNNIFRAMSYLSGNGHECEYVIGYAQIKHLPFPIDHAWIVIDGVHHDPTWQLHSETEHCHYDARYILNMAELLDFIMQNDNRPPSCEDMRLMEWRLKQDNQKEI